MQEEMMKNPEEAAIAATETAERFGELALVPAAEGSICGDGGYEATVETTNGGKIEVKGATAMLGADLSPIAIAISDHAKREKNYDAAELTNRGIDAVIGRYGRFDFHTSHHEGHGGKLTDCGHAFAMTKPENAELYGLPAEAAVKMVETAKKRSQEDPERVVEQNLDRDHGERMVIVNQGEKTTFIHWLTTKNFSELNEVFSDAGDDGVMMFVVDAKRAAQRHEEIWLEMGYTEEDLPRLHEIRQQQADATNGGLASGLGVVEMNWDDPENRVTEYLGVMQADGSVVK